MRIVNNKERQELKIKLIFPPQWYPTSPYLSVPLLVGQLRAAGYDAASVDFKIHRKNDQRIK